MGKIIYNRNTTYPITHIWQYNGAPSTTGQKIFFTVKTTQYDSDPTDSAAILKKTVAMSGSTNTFTINDSDISDSVNAGKYYYDLKVLDSSLGMILSDSGTFKLTATPTNRET